MVEVSVPCFTEVTCVAGHVRSCDWTGQDLLSEVPGEGEDGPRGDPRLLASTSLRVDAPCTRHDELFRIYMTTYRLEDLV